jgi:hypothetical protein
MTETRSVLLLVLNVPKAAASLIISSYRFSRSSFPLRPLLLLQPVNRRVSSLGRILNPYEGRLGVSQRHFWELNMNRRFLLGVSYVMTASVV